MRTQGFEPGEQLRTAASQEPAGCCSLSRGKKFQDLPFLSSLFLLNPQSGFLGETKLPGRQERERERGLGKLVTLVVMAASSCQRLLSAADQATCTNHRLGKPSHTSSRVLKVFQHFLTDIFHQNLTLCRFLLFYPQQNKTLYQILGFP